MDSDLQSKQVGIVEAFEARHRTGLVTLLFTDLADSTRLKSELGDVIAGALIDQHHTLVRQVLARFPESQEVSTAGDSFFIVFDSPSNAVHFSLLLQAELRKLAARAKHPLRDRIGIHVGEVFVELDASHGRTRNFSGIHIDTASRVMGLCEPGRILLTRFCFENARQVLRGKRLDGLGDARWVSHGLFVLKGVSGPVEICEVGEEDRVEMTPLVDSEKARRVVGLGLPGWAEAGEQREEDRSLAGRVKRALRNQWREGAAGAATAMLLGLFLWATPLGQKIGFWSYDLAYAFRSVESPKEVMIVYQDDASVAPLGQTYGVPWDRAIHARLIDRLREAGARAVVLDYLFDLRGPPESDRKLIDALRRSTNVFLAASAEEIQSRGVQGTQPELPFEELRQAARWGFVERAANRHEIVRRHYRPPADLGIRSLAEMVAADLANTKSSAATSTRWFNFYGPAKTLPWISYHQALNRNDAPDELFQNKVVFVGDMPGVALQAGGGTNASPHRDTFFTPYSGGRAGKAAGVELLATAYLNVARGEWIERISTGMELIAVVFCGAALGFPLAMMRPRNALAAAAVASVCFAVLFPMVMWKTLTWWGWSLVVVVQLPAAVLISLMVRNERLKRQNRSLAETIVTQQTEFISRATVLQSSGTSVVVAPQAGAKPTIPDHELYRVVGKGAYGEVWLGKDLTGSLRAIKVVKSSAFNTSRPFEREFEGLKRFAPISREHPGLIQVLHVGKMGEGCFYYIMEAADDHTTGPVLSPDRYEPDSIARRISVGKPLSVAEVCDVGAQICAALEFLHSRGLIHRDIKPANLLFVGGRVKLADIGLVTGADTEDQHASLVGTPAYMAPEGPGAPQSDLYSLGMVLYEMAVGKRPESFPELPTRMNAGADDTALFALNQVILKACDAQPSRRHSNARELREALEQVLRDVHRGSD